MSICTLKQNGRGTLHDFTNIKSNLNMSRFDWKCSPVHEYWSNQSKWTFPRKYQKGCGTFFPRWANELSSVIVVILRYTISYYNRHWFNTGVFQGMSSANERRNVVSYWLIRSLNQMLPVTRIDSTTPMGQCKKDVIQYVSNGVRSFLHLSIDMISLKRYLKRHICDWFYQ